MFSIDIHPAGSLGTMRNVLNVRRKFIAYFICDLYVFFVIAGIMYDRLVAVMYVVFVRPVKETFPLWMMFSTVETDRLCSTGYLYVAKV